MLLPDSLFLSSWYKLSENSFEVSHIPSVGLDLQDCFLTLFFNYRGWSCEPSPFGASG